LVIVGRARRVFFSPRRPVTRPVLDPRYDFLPRTPLGIVWSLIGEELSPLC